MARRRALAAREHAGQLAPLERVRRERGAPGEWHTLLDLGPLEVVPMAVRPLDAQLPNESRRLWQPLTQRLLAKEYSEATKAKIAIEQKQRDDAAARKAKGVTYVFLT